MLLIGTAAGAGSFTHVHDVAAAHGQAGWLAWADAVVLELMSIASGLELRRRRQAHAPVVFPAAVLATAVVLSLGAQVVDAEPSPIGWIAAAIPALGFLVMVKIALGHSTTSPDLCPANTMPPATPPSSQPRDTVESADGPDDGASGDAAVLTLLPLARITAHTLRGQGRRLTRHALAEALRADGHAISNARTGTLLAILKAEEGSYPPEVFHAPARNDSSVARGMAGMA
jgi:hypothetical protein